MPYSLICFFIFCFRWSCREYRKNYSIFFYFNNWEASLFGLIIFVCFLFYLIVVNLEGKDLSILNSKILCNLILRYSSRTVYLGALFIFYVLFKLRGSLNYLFADIFWRITLPGIFGIFFLFWSYFVNSIFILIGDFILECYFSKYILFYFS